MQLCYQKTVTREFELSNGNQCPTKEIKNHKVCEKRAEASSYMIYENEVFSSYS